MEQQHHHDHHMNHKEHGKKNEIDVTISYNNNLLSIHIEDSENKPPKLIMNHEKLLHLVVISEDLKEFLHLHPNQMDENTFEQEIKLEENKAFKAFVDITVEGKNFFIKPINVSRKDNSNKKPLKLDNIKSRTLQGKNIDFEHSPFVINQKVELHFNINNATPDPYLGALGHVVIVDEQLEKFIHVHPKNNNITTFETHFDTPGKYKLWAEFKFGQDIVIFPYVFEVNREQIIH